MVAAKYFNMFILFSFFGWIYECIYCTCKTRTWQNRGFLWGPICPIYGVGATTAIAVFGDILPYYMSGKTGSAGIDLPIREIFLISAVGSAIIEYVTSWTLEKCFHAVWWDYSSVPFNIHGRICLPATCGFGAAGVLIVRYLVPFIEHLPKDPYPLFTEITALFFMFLFGADMALTVDSLSKLVARMENLQKEFDARVEAGVETIQEGPAAVGAAMISGAKAAGVMAKDGAVSAARSVKDSAATAAKSAKDSAESAAKSAKDSAESAAKSAKDNAISAAKSAMDSAESAARNVRDAASLAEEAMTGRLHDFADNWSSRERYHFGSIKQFRSRGTIGVSAKIRRMLEEASNRINEVTEKREIKENSDKE